MSERRETLWVLALNGLQILLTALSFLRLANVLGPADYGIYSFAFAIAAFLPLLAGLGADHVFIMQASRDPQAVAALLGNAVVLRAITSIPISVAVLIASIWLRYSSVVVLGLLSAGALVMAFAQPLLASYYRVIGRPRYVWVCLLIGQGLYCGFLYLTPSLTTVSAAVGYLVTSVLTLGLLVANIRSQIRIRLDPFLLRSNLRLGGYFSASQLLDLGFQRVDVLFLQYLLGPAAVGTYVAGYRLVSLFLVIPAALHIVQLPDFHRATVDPQALQSRFRAMRATLIEVSSLVFGLLFVSSERITALVLTRSYLPASRVLAISCIGMMITFVTYPYSMLAEAQGKVKTRVVLRVIALLSALFLLPLAVKALGISGAAAAVTAAAAVFLVLLHLQTRTSPGTAPGLLRDCAPIVPCAIAGVIVATTSGLYGSGLSGLLLSAACFVAIFIALGSVLNLVRLFDARLLYRAALQIA